MNRPIGVYRVMFSDQTESINYWDGEAWRFFGMTSKCTDEEMGFSYLYPITAYLRSGK